MRHAEQRKWEKSFDGDVYEENSLKRACTGNEEDVNRKQSTGNTEMITDEKGYTICAS